MKLPLAVPAILICAMYFFSGAEKFWKLERAAEGLRKRTFAGPLWFFVLAVTVSSAMLVLTSSTVAYASISGRARAWARASALYLAAFTVLATVLYHWPPTGKTYYPFISNVTAIGGLLLLADQFEKKVGKI